MKPIYIGVDPAFRSGGFWACVVDMTDKTARFLSFRDLLEWHDWLRSDEAPEQAFIAVENSNAQNQTFARHMKGTQAERMRRSRNVGTNQAVSQLAYESAVRRYGKGLVFSVSPEEKGRKYSPAQFAQVVRFDGITLPKASTNQDQRDAYQLAAIARRHAIVSGKFSKKIEIIEK